MVTLLPFIAVLVLNLRHISIFPSATQAKQMPIRSILQPTYLNYLHDLRFEANERMGYQGADLV